MTTSNPTMAVREWLACKCETYYEQRYQDPKPEVHEPRKCATHGNTSIIRWSRVSR